MNIALFESEIPRDITNDDEILNAEPNDEDIIDSEEPDEGNEDGSTNNQGNSSSTSKPIDYSSYYVGTLEIPKIKLKKGFLEINSPYNNVNKNVTVIQTSTYPDVENGNFILAAHTGTSSVSFFTKLHDLVLGDLAYINYKQKKYTYELVNIYTQPKVGSVSIYRNTEKTTLTLITCTPNNQETQTIFILELINVE